MSLRPLASPEASKPPPTSAEVMSDSFGSELSEEAKAMTGASSDAAPASLARRASSRRWYSDSEDEEGDELSNQAVIAPMSSSLQGTPVVSDGGRTKPQPAMNRRASASALPATAKEKAPTPDLPKPASEAPLARPPSTSGFQKLVEKTKVLSPFRRPSATTKQPLVVDTQQQPAKQQTDTPPSSASLMASAVPAPSRRQSSRMLMRASSDQTLAPTPEDEPDDAFQLGGLDALSPGRGALGGATSGVPGSGVLLEGWLRQKQRRGIRGLKTWNSRYFVLYAKSNEMRYFGDVVQSGWGPIPLGELGCISLRSIQRISKPSHPKYKGCRFDITCRTTSQEENVLSSDDDVAKKPAKTTPKASREYCLVSDSPQTTATWVNMLDSLLTRSVNSPRPETLAKGANNGGSAGSSMCAWSIDSVLTRDIPGSLKALVQLNSQRQKQQQQQANPLTPPSAGTNVGPPPPPAISADCSVFVLPNDVVPKAIVLAIEYIFESYPGIETSVVTFLNQCAIEQRKPSRNEWEDALDVVSAGSVVKLWLRQLEAPIVPYELFDEFKRVMEDGAHAPFELLRNLKGLLAALPPKKFKMMAYLVFHWNDVTVYATKNQLTAAALARQFSPFVFQRETGDKADDTVMQSIVEYMITHADVLIDEKEAELLE
ncbi:Aste57867_11596 [Aphanomyces stellatus]|uniref:Aste57867_11596 protein n=1 Tax=Aphanomyces stellatus TaxID=120398 RepID=A0A485KTZ2_9STRA|nr:hypothetical protein As57867_011553 [Aphanomyces stellatus]VFT88455.1 Aste57867_11596 [Aphanomyces stellatus]